MSEALNALGDAIVAALPGPQRETLARALCHVRAS